MSFSKVAIYDYICILSHWAEEKAAGSRKNVTLNLKDDMSLT